MKNIIIKIEVIFIDNIIIDNKAVLMKINLVLGRGHHPYVLRSHDALEAVGGELQKRASTSEDVDKLLGIVGGTHGPETTADTSCHYDEMIVRIHVSKIEMYVISLQSYK